MKTLQSILALALLALCLAAAALAEPARVQTPGGPVNLRKKGDAKSTVVAEVPNRALVEAVEIGDTWTKITYKNKTGYVKTEFLLLTSALEGKTLYPAANGEILALTAPDPEAELLRAFNSDEPIRIETVREGWAAITVGESVGYIQAEALLDGLETPGDSLRWIPQQGRTVQACTLTLGGGRTATLPAGTAVTVCRLNDDGKTCLADTPLGWGTAACAEIRLNGYADEAVGLPEGISATEAAEKAETRLKKAYKPFGKQRMYCVVTLYKENAYRCGFFSDEGQLLYCAVIDGQGACIAQDAYAAFAAPDPDADLLPRGEVQLTLSADSLSAGEVLDIDVAAWTRHSVQYSLSGPVSVETEPGAHFAAAWRPRQAGSYTLTVTVADEDGLSVSRQQAVTVLPGAAAGLETVYSQKDGWWLEAPYRNSTLDQSGCAIFTLSHALSRMGRTGEELLPENLARTFALCLTPDGTNNERLIREAAALFGFKTQSALISDQKQIARLLREGAMFSFSIARGHIALISGISEDGAMVQVVDSAPFATFDRIVNDSLYYRLRSGSFRAALSMEDLPGVRWYLDTDDYGGLEYWLRLSYVARRGVRLIQPGS